VEYNISTFQRGGSGGAGNSSSSASIDDVIQRYKAFPGIAAANPFAFETEIATYDTIALAVPTPEEEEDFLRCLRDAREKKMRYLQKRNDFEFAKQHPEFYQNPPNASDLDAAIYVYTNLVNEVARHARRVSRGEIPPDLFQTEIREPNIHLVPIVPAEPSRPTPPPVVPTIPVRRLPSSLEQNIVRWVIMDNLRTLDELVNHPDNVLHVTFNWTDETLAFFWSGVVFKYRRISDGTFFNPTDDLSSENLELAEQQPADGILAVGEVVTLGFRRG